MFYDGVKKSDLGIKNNVLKHLHGQMIFVPLYIYSMKVLFGEDIEH